MSQPTRHCRFLDRSGAVVAEIEVRSPGDVAQEVTYLGRRYTLTGTIQANGLRRAVCLESPIPGKPKEPRR